MDSKIEQLFTAVNKLVESKSRSRSNYRRSRSSSSSKPGHRSRYRRSNTRSRSWKRSPGHRPSNNPSSSVLDLGQDYRGDDFDEPDNPHTPDGLRSGKDGNGKRVKPRSGPEAAAPNTEGSPSKTGTGTHSNLDDEVLDLLGDSRQQKEPEGPPLHDELAHRWNSIAANGLSPDEKTKLQTAYPPPSNCNSFFGPSLNPEVKAALSAFTLQRDNEIQLFQAQLGVGVTALASSLSKVFSWKEKLDSVGISSKEVIGQMSDAGRGLLDLQHSLSSHRRTVIAPNIKTNVKSLIKDTGIDKFLFGADLPQRIKTMQELNKAGQDIRQASTHPKSKPRPMK